MTLYSEYEAFVKEYIAEYGEKTVVFYRCGGFYEIYSADDGLVDIKRICELLNIQMSRRNKSILEVTRSNTLMAGFPAHSLQKFINILVNDNFTVVVVDQVSDPPKPKRAVTAVLSPGTDINNLTSPETSNLLCICFDVFQDFQTKKSLMVVGAAVIDLSTGKSKVFEVASTCKDPYFALDEIYRVIQTESPREILMIGCHPGDNALQHLEIDGKCVHQRFTAAMETNIHFQSELLRKVFPKHGLLSVIEYLDMEMMPIAINSFVHLLQFCYKHNELILQKLHKPIIVHQSNKLTLSYNCVKHLNIISNDSRINSLLSILNRCVTAIGKRLFKDRFLNPITDINELKRRYDCIDFITNRSLYDQVLSMLDKVFDIERLFRRVSLLTINPAEFCYIYDSVTVLKDVLALVKDTVIMSSNDFTTNHQALISIQNDITKTFDITEIRKYNLDNLSNSFFKTGMYLDVDEAQNQMEVHLSFLDQLTRKLNEVVKSDMFKLDYNLVDGYFLTVTAKRFNDTKSILNNFEFSNENYRFSYNSVHAKPGNVHKISHECFRDVSRNVEASKLKLSGLLKLRFMDYLADFTKQYSDAFGCLTDFVGTIDFFATCAKTAQKHRYYRPNIDNMYDDKSYVKGNNLRHPIIERLCSNVEYVSNDVELGTERTKGMLLYGTNMVGKSAYMKSIGISIIMAQSGMFVPCENMTFYPYTSIFTRIPSGDDLFKGQSTFAVEISELRNILKRAGRNSLVIGDELASGTESISAISIVAAGLTQLYQRDTSFIFATHLHDLVSLKTVQELQKLRVCHLSVLFEDKTNKLVFDRKIKDGQGSTLYGLEVCRALDLDSDFITLANDFRHELCNTSNSIMKNKKSKYNSQVFIDECSVCKSVATEVHHIKQQMLADEKGFIGFRHKNDKSNLMSVCDKCHDKIHNGELQVNGYVQTSDGVELKTAVVDASIKTGKKVDLEKDIVKMRDQGLPLTKIKDAIFSQHGVVLSIYKIGKILRK